MYFPNINNELLYNILNEFKYAIKIGINKYYNKYKYLTKNSLYKYLVYYLMMHKCIIEFKNKDFYINELNLYNVAFNYHIKWNWKNRKTSKAIYNDILNNNIKGNIIKITKSERKNFKNINFNLTYKENLDVIISSYNDINGINDLLNILSKTNHNITCYIYEKGNTKYNLKDYNFKINIIHLPNIGREQHTYLYHIINNYDNLADNILMTPSNINRYPGRIDIIKKNIDFLVSNICCNVDLDGSSNILAGQKEYFVHNNGYGKVCRTNFKNLYKYFNKILNKFRPDENSCFNGTYFTKNFFIKNNSIDYYKKIINTIKCDIDESGYHLERIMNLVYT